MVKKKSFYNEETEEAALAMLENEPATVQAVADPQQPAPTNRPSRKGIPLKAAEDKKSKRLQLVLTPGEYEKLKAWAEAEGRSINGLISYLINTH